MRHLEISLADSGLTYQPGDALGVYFSNDPAIVQAILQATGIAPDTAVTLDGSSLDIQTALTEKLELTQSYPSFCRKICASYWPDSVAAIGC